VQGALPLAAEAAGGAQQTEPAPAGTGDAAQAVGYLAAYVCTVSALYAQHAAQAALPVASEVASDTQQTKHELQQAAGSGKKEKERQRKERQRQRKMEEAREALQVAIEAMLDARCVIPLWLMCM
jgi:hypothetical protein